MAFQKVEWMGIRQNVVEVSISATRAPRQQREHVPATGFVRRIFLLCSIRKQKQTIPAGDLCVCVSLSWMEAVFWVCLSLKFVYIHNSHGSLFILNNTHSTPPLLITIFPFLVQFFHLLSISIFNLLFHKISK